MAVIPGFYDSRTRAQGASLGVGPSGDAGALLNAAGNILEFHQEKERRLVKQKDDEQATVAAQESLMGVRTHWLEELKKRQETAPENGEGFTDGVLKDFDTQAQEAVASGKTPEARQWLRERLDASRLSLQEESQQFEAVRRATYKANGITRATDQASTLAEFRPQDFPTLLAEQREAIINSGLSADAQDKLQQHAIERMSSAAVEGMIRRDPQATLAELNNEKTENTAVKLLPFDLRQRLRGQAETEIRQRESEARAQRAEARDILTDDLQDAFTARQAGLPASMPSRGRFVAAYGTDGAKRYADAQASWGVFDVVAQAAHQTPVEAAKTLEQLKPKDQAGAADAMKRYDTATKLWQQQRQELEADPVGALMSRDPSLAQQATAAESPEDMAAYLNTVRAKQEALGVEKPKLLPNAMRDQIAQQLTFNPEKPGARMATLQSIRDTYGREFPNVVAEIAPKLEGSARVLVNMNPEDGKRLDAAMAQDSAKVNQLVTADVRKQITDEIDLAFNPLEQTLADNPDAESRIVEHREAARVLAQSLVLRGSSAKDAATQATNAVVNSRYRYHNTMRVPIDYDLNTVVSGARAKLNEVAKQDLSISPGVYSDAAAAQADIREHVLKEGYWITNEDETGLVLRIPHRSGQGEVYGKDGNRIEYTFEQLLGAAGKHDPGWAPWVKPGDPGVAPWMNP